MAITLSRCNATDVTARITRATTQMTTSKSAIQIRECFTLSVRGGRHDHPCQPQKTGPRSAFKVAGGSSRRTHLPIRRTARPRTGPASNVACNSALLRPTAPAHARHAPKSRRLSRRATSPSQKRNVTSAALTSTTLSSRTSSYGAACSRRVHLTRHRACLRVKRRFSASVATQ